MTFYFKIRGKLSVVQYDAKYVFSVWLKIISNPAVWSHIGKILIYLECYGNVLSNGNFWWMKNFGMNNSAVKIYLSIYLGEGD